MQHRPYAKSSHDRRKSAEIPRLDLRNFENAGDMKLKAGVSQDNPRQGLTGIHFLPGEVHRGEAAGVMGRQIWGGEAELGFNPPYS